MINLDEVLDINNLTWIDNEELKFLVNYIIEQNKEIIIFKDEYYHIKYIKYVIEYLDNKFKIE